MINAVKNMSLPENSIQMRTACNLLKTSLRVLAKIPENANTLRVLGAL